MTAHWVTLFTKRTFAALTTALAIPLAVALVTTGWPRLSLSFCPISRARTSMPPPAA